MASDHIWMSSPACAPTMPAPRIVPSRAVMTLTWPVVEPLRLGAIVLAVRPAQDVDLADPLLRLGFRQTDVGEFGIGEGHARDQCGASTRAGT